MFWRHQQLRMNTHMGVLKWLSECYIRWMLFLCSGIRKMDAHMKCGGFMSGVCSIKSVIVAIVVAIGKVADPEI